MIEWLKNYFVNFDMSDLMVILNAIFSTSVGAWALRVYVLYKKLKEKDIETVVKDVIGKDNQTMYDNITNYLDAKLEEQNSKIEQVNTNLILSSVGKMTDSDRVIAMINNSNLTSENKTEVKDIVVNTVKTEEQLKQEKINTLESM